MELPHKVLIVDDHPIIIDSYCTILEHISNQNESSVKFSILTADCCDSAIYHIENSSSANPINIALLDIRIPASNYVNYHSGECIAKRLKQSFPECKIVLFTSHSDNYRLLDLIKSVNPDGFLIKSDMGMKELIDAVNAVLRGIPYYSKTVLNLMRQQYLQELHLDDIDKRMLHELSSGVQTKDLPKVLPLSIAAIERRKRKLKSMFDVECQKDGALLQKAKQIGYI